MTNLSDFFHRSAVVFFQWPFYFPLLKEQEDPSELVQIPTLSQPILGSQLGLLPPPIPLTANQQVHKHTKPTINVYFSYSDGGGLLKDDTIATQIPSNYLFLSS